MSTRHENGRPTDRDGAENPSPPGKDGVPAGPAASAGFGIDNGLPGPYSETGSALGCIPVMADLPFSSDPRVLRTRHATRSG